MSAFLGGTSALSARTSPTASGARGRCSRAGTDVEPPLAFGPGRVRVGALSETTSTCSGRPSRARRRYPRRELVVDVLPAQHVRAAAASSSLCRCSPRRPPPPEPELDRGAAAAPGPPGVRCGASSPRTGKTADDLVHALVPLVRELDRGREQREHVVSARPPAPTPAPMRPRDRFQEREQTPLPLVPDELLHAPACAPCARGRSDREHQVQLLPPAPAPCAPSAAASSECGGPIAAKSVAARRRRVSPKISPTIPCNSQTLLPNTHSDTARRGSASPVLHQRLRIFPRTQSGFSVRLLQFPEHAVRVVRPRGGRAPPPARASLFTTRQTPTPPP